MLKGVITERLFLRYGGNNSDRDSFLLSFTYISVALSQTCYIYTRVRGCHRRTRKITACSQCVDAIQSTVPLNRQALANACIEGKDNHVRSLFEG